MLSAQGKPAPTGKKHYTNTQALAIQQQRRWLKAQPLPLRVPHDHPALQRRKVPAYFAPCRRQGLALKATTPNATTLVGYSVFPVTLSSLPRDYAAQHYVVQRHKLQHSLMVALARCSRCCSRCLSVDCRLLSAVSGCTRAGRGFHVLKRCRHETASKKLFVVHIFSTIFCIDL